MINLTTSRHHRYYSNHPHHHGTISKKLLMLVFAFFLLVNIASSGGHFDPWDGTETFLVTESMVLKHTAKLVPASPSVQKLHFDICWSELDRAIRQGLSLPYSSFSKPCDVNTIPPLYTFRSLLLSAIAVPFYYAAIISSVYPVAIVGLFVNSLVISLTCLVLFCFSAKLYGSSKIGFVISLMYGLCSFVWPYHTSLWPQPLQALTLIASAFFIYICINDHNRFSFICYYYYYYTSSTPDNKKNIGYTNNKRIYSYAGLAGLFLGLSVFAHPTSLLLIPAFIVYSIFSMRRNRKSLISFLMILGITLSFVGVINSVRFGSFAQFGYGYEGGLASHTSWIGLIGLLASPGVGLIFYFPMAILLPLAFIFMYRENKGLFFLSCYLLFASWLYFGTITGDLLWSGSIAWGPRYLIPVLPFLTLVCGALFIPLQRHNVSRQKVLFIKLAVISLCAVGFFVSLFGTIIWVFYTLFYAIITQPLHMAISDPYYSPIILQIKTLLSGYVSHINPEHYVPMRFWSSLHQGLAPCPIDVYVLCKFGSMSTLILFAIIVTFAILVIFQISNFNLKRGRPHMKILRTSKPVSY